MVHSWRPQLTNVEVCISSCGDIADRVSFEMRVFLGDRSYTKESRPDSRTATKFPPPQLQNTIFHTPPESLQDDGGRCQSATEEGKTTVRQERVISLSHCSWQWRREAAEVDSRKIWPIPTEEGDTRNMLRVKGFLQCQYEAKEGYDTYGSDGRGKSQSMLPTATTQGDGGALRRLQWETSVGTVKVHSGCDGSGRSHKGEGVIKGVVGCPKKKLEAPRADAVWPKRVTKLNDWSGTAHGTPRVASCS